ncbi:hypothetical protein KAR26_02535 [Candidatus Parcubacteria bacterium]|nr:hypothetical protein [Candidatus Parcubacteria bacterium]
MAEKRVGIFIYYEWLSISPSLVSVVRSLTENGYIVDIFHLYDEKIGVLKPEFDNVNLISIRSGKRKWLTAISFLTASLKNIIKHKYKFFIGADQEGIIVSGILGKIKKTPYIYYSLEILTKEDIAKEKGIRRFALSVRKMLENHFSRNARITVAQDKYRAGILIRDNNISKENIFIVPNSYYFTSEKPCDAVDFQLPADKKIVLYAGSIQPEMAIEDIIRYVELWPENTILFLHTPYRSAYLEKIEKYIKEKKLEQKVIVSLKQLSFEELCCLIAKADIGISFYRPVNESFASGPSGKVSFYLSQGIPIITNKIPSVMDLVQKYKCGICVDTAKEAGEAIATILNNYSEFCADTKTCYKNELEFSKHFKKVLEHIESSF